MASEHIPGTLDVLGHRTAEEFMADYWQKRPLLVRRAFDPRSVEIPFEDLRELASREEVESLLLVQDDERGGWTSRDGPLEPSELDALGGRCWTLLVHEVDRFVVGAAELLDRFRFLPNWRIDDVMVSYAVPGAGVGAHVDEYDVFLLQTGGVREWAIEERPSTAPTGRSATGHRSLDRFEPDQRWSLEPGDLLYLPPRIPHRGVAIETGTTCSVGFRAPSHRELAAGFLQHVVESVGPEGRYADPDLRPQRDPGRIPPATVERVGAALRELVDDPERLTEWLGRFLTEPRRESSVPSPRKRPAAAELRRRLAAGDRLRPISVPAFAWIDSPAGGRILFAGGQSWPLDDAIAEAGPLLGGREPLDQATLAGWLERPAFVSLLRRLVAEGLLVLEPGQGSPRT